MKKTILLILLVATCCMGATGRIEAASVTLNNQTYELNNHPRLLINNSNIAALRARATNANPMWNMVVNYCGDYYSSNPDPSALVHTLAVPVSEVIVNFALMYAINPDTYRHYGEYAKAALLIYTDPSHYDVSNPPANPNRDYGSIHLTHFALIYDWIYPLIQNDTAYKQKFLTWLNDVMIPMVQQHEQIVARPPNGYRESNLAVTKWAGELLIGLATYEDNMPGTYGSSGNNSELYVSRKLKFWTEELKPLRDQYYSGGHAWDGSHYSYARSLPLLFLGLEAIETSFNFDVFNTLSGEWDKDLLLFFLYSMMPDNYHFYSEGVLAEDHDFHYGRVLQPFYFSVYKNRGSNESAYGQYFLANHVKPTATPEAVGQVAGLYTYYWFLWYDPNAASTNYATVLPNAYLADGIDVFFSKSDWTSSTATHLSFACSDMVSGDAADVRQGMNITSYKIWKDGYLLYENGKSASGVTASGDESRYHNTIFLDDGYITNSWGARKFTGGFIQMRGTYYDGGMVYPQADITVFDTTPLYSYAVGDASKAYMPNKINKHYRTILHVLPAGGDASANDYIVVYDQMDSVAGAGLNGGSVVKTSYLHFPNEPQISGDTLGAVSNTSQSKIFMKTLLPSNPVISKERETKLTSGITGDQPWLVKVRRNDAVNSEQFLHVYHATTNLAKTMPGVVLLSDANQSVTVGNMAGCIIYDTFENKVVLLTDDASQKNISQVSYSVETTTGARHYLFGMKPNTVFAINIANANPIQAQSNANGGLTFVTSAIGSNAISVTATDSAVQTTYALSVEIPTGGGTVSPGAGYFSAGTIVDLVATPQDGYRVSSWQGTNDDSAISNTNNVTINDDTAVTVRFEQLDSGTVTPGSGEPDTGGDTSSSDVTTFYVKTNGSDDNDGASEAGAWQTLQAAADNAQAGDTIVIGAGNYAGFRAKTSGTAGAPITFKAETGATVVIDNVGPEAWHGSIINIEGFDWWVLDGLEIANAPSGAGVDVRTSHHVTVKNCTIKDNYKWGIFTAFSDYFVAENNRISNTQTQHGIYLSNSGDKATIVNNICFNNYLCGIQVNADPEAGGDGICSNMTITRNVLYGNGTGGGAALNFASMRDSLVANNLIYNNSAGGIAAWDDGEGIQWGCKNNAFYNNTVHMPSAARSALNFGNGSTGNKVINNILIHDNSYRVGIEVDATSLTGLQSDYNLVTRVAASGSFMDLGDWQASYGQDSHSSGDTLPNNLFVQPGSYQIDQSSSAFDAGIVLAEVADDVIGTHRPQGASYDIGAYEFVTSGSGGQRPPAPTLRITILEE